MKNDALQKALLPDISHWITQYAAQLTDQEREEISQACHVAAQYRVDTPTCFATDSLTQGLAMAELLIGLNCDSDTIIASIWYPILLYNETVTAAKQKTLLSPIVKKLIDGAVRMNLIHQARGKKNRETAQQNQIDNLRKMLLAMVDDIRTVLIKLSERLIVLKNLKSCEPDVQRQIAQDVMDYYAPLANRLGIGQLKWQLEDLAFRYLNSEEYQAIFKALNHERVEREQLIHTMMKTLQTLLEAHQIKGARISGRAKHIYSIYRKVTKKHIPFERLFDMSALRILVPTVADCYETLGVVHAKWQHIPAEFDDYIAKPKPNGYQSIHTAVMQNNHPVEIQIRTIDMHEKAELGIAAHWKYKENKKTHSTYEEKITWLREVLDWQKTVDSESRKNTLFQDAFSDRVYVFSPEGDVFDLPAGSTPLDFAYLVHTEIGHRCRGAKVNNKIIPLTHVLDTGDCIEIQTAKEPHPSHDWLRPELHFLKTIQAIRKVRHWFKQKNYQKYLAEGEDLWEKTAKQKGFQKTDLEKLVLHFHFKNVEMLLAALGSGDLSITALTHQLIQQPSPVKNPHTHLSRKISHSRVLTNEERFSIHSGARLLTQLARCCHPIPGDAVMGYITQGRGISVHKSNCQNMQKSLSEKPERIIDINWKSQEQKSYRVRLMISSEDRTGLLKDISGLLAQHHISILSLQSHVNANTQLAGIMLEIEFTTETLLTELIKQLKQVNGVLSVSRQ